MIENAISRRIKSIKTDRGGKFTSDEMTCYCMKHGIRRQLTAPHTPQQNGVAERKNRIIQEMARTMLTEEKVSERFWAFAVHTAVHVMNRCILHSHESKTPYELIFGKKPNVDYFRIFGSKSWILRKGTNLGKFEDRSDEGLFFGLLLIFKSLQMLQ